MSSSSTFKKRIRAYAAENDVTYTEARRVLLGSISDLGDEARAVAQETISQSTLAIHRATDDRGRLPKPWFVHRNGLIRRQDFWRGEAYFLIGFEDPATAAASPDGHDITVSREEWFKDPQSVIGMRVVFMNRQRQWATWDGLVETVREQESTTAAPERAILTARANGIEEQVLVGHLLEHLTPDDLTEAEAAGWDDTAATDELLWMASISGDAAAEYLANLLDDMERDRYRLTVTGPAVSAPNAALED